MTKHPKMTHSSSFLGCIKPIGLRGFKVVYQGVRPHDICFCASSGVVLQKISSALGAIPARLPPAYVR